jgi:hypothetical protein
MIILSIDPGVHTGFAAWCTDSRKLLDVACYKAVEAEIKVLQYCCQYDDVLLLFEDARKRTWYGNKGAESLQGAGSVKRDSQRWQEFCEYHGIKYRAMPPQRGATKWDSERFAKVTGWTGRTNEHGRDAAMMVYGRNAVVL